jgi:hypothetical protein
MSEIEQELKVGCTVWVRAARFDDNDDDRWSVMQFGALADTHELECRLVSHRAGRWKLHVIYDDSYYTLETAALIHKAAICRHCLDIRSQRPHDDPSKAAGPSDVSLQNSGGLRESGAGGEYEDPGTGFSDTDDEPLNKTVIPERRVENRPNPLQTIETRVEEPPPCPRPARARRGRPLRRSNSAAAAPPSTAFDEIDDPHEESASEDNTETSESSDIEEDGVEEDAVSGGGRSGGGRGRGRGRGRGSKIRSAGSSKHAETPTTVKRDNVVWEKGVGREIDPRFAGAGLGHTGRARINMQNILDKTEREFFEHCFPTHMLVSMARVVSDRGKEMFNRNWEVDVADIWVFLGIKQYMMVFPQEGPRKDYWEIAPQDANEKQEVFIYHNLGNKYNMSFNFYKEIERAFVLPTYGDDTDVFDSIRLFSEEWNKNMSKAISPGAYITVDESMGGWTGKGMPGLMFVPRKPTELGRECHTTACCDTGCIIWQEPYEGSLLMAKKKYCKEHGKNPAKAMRCTEAWQGTGRTVILDSGFMSVQCASGLMDVGLYSIGNVKSGSRAYPKDWLRSQVHVRGDTAVASATCATKKGKTISLLASIDMDKQPMALLGTAGTSNKGETITRNFTTIRRDGTYNVRTAVMEHDDIHDKYRKHFNALDKHNAVRQGGACLETSWHTQRWYIRDFQMLWGFSEVNAWLLWQYARAGDTLTENGQQTFARFRRRLNYQILNHPLRFREERMMTRGLAAGGCSLRHELVANVAGVANTGVNRKRRACKYCGRRTDYHCSCDPTISICSTRGNSKCFATHVSGKAPINRKSEAAKQRQKRARELHRASR